MGYHNPYCIGHNASIVFARRGRVKKIGRKQTVFTNWGGVCGLNRVYLEAGTRVFCYLIKNKERQLPNKPYVGFWVGKAGNLNNLNIGVDRGEGVGPGI